MRTIIVTGANGNVGQACVNHFEARDWRALKVMSSRGAARTSGADIYGVDATDESHIQRFTETLHQQSLMPEVAVLTVGGFEPGKIATTDNALLDKMIALNFKSAFFFAQKLAGYMMYQEIKGKIVFIASKTAVRPDTGAGAAAYTISKSMLITLAELMNAEYLKHGIAVHLIAPGTIDTPQNREAMPDADVGKWTKPIAIAAVVEGLITVDEPQRIMI